MKKTIVILLIHIIAMSDVFGQIYSPTFNSNKDSYTISSNTSNYGTSTELQAGINVTLGVATYRRSFVNCPISGIPSNAIVTSAVLKFYQTSGNTSSSTNVLYAERITSTWDESTIKSTLEPTVSTSEIVTSSTYASNIRSFDVTTHVQKMVSGAYTNLGWRIRFHNEAQTTANLFKFHSREALNDPFLQVTYYIPYSVSAATITHASSPTVADGSISTTIINGPNSGTYQWYEGATGNLISGATSSTLSNIGFGWYGLKISGNQGAPVYQAFIVGVKCQNVDITFNPGPDYIDDALLNNQTINLPENFGNHLDFTTQNNVIATRWYSEKSLLRFKLWLDNQFSVSLSDLTLYGKNHDTSVRSNASKILKSTSNWTESGVCWNTTPTTTTTNSIALSTTSSSTQNRTVSMTNFWNDWKANNLQNYGMLMELDLFNGTLSRMCFHSSDATASSLRPSISFTLSLSALSGCSPQTIDDISYSELKYDLDGGYATTFSNKLKISFKDESRIATSKYIPFVIKDKNNLILAGSDINGTCFGGAVSIAYKSDSNNKEVNLSGITALSLNSYYTIEVTMSNGTTKKLRFLYKN